MSKFNFTRPLLRLLQYNQRRFLDLHEYQSKQILHENDINVQRFKVVSNANQARSVLYADGNGDYGIEEKWSGIKGDISNSKEYVIKAQILAGGRGRGHFVNSNLQGGVKLTKSKEQAVDYAERMLNDYLVTKQTTPSGALVEKVMIAEALDIRDEFYLAILLDRHCDEGPIIVTSVSGGMDIEEVAEKNPEAIKKFIVPITDGLSLEQAQLIAHNAFNIQPNDKNLLNSCGNQIKRLYDMFLRLDATQLEINPLGITFDNQVYSFDAKINFDENAKFRQKWLNELESMNANDRDARENAAHKHNLNYIALDGNIGCLVNGAGLAMATMDIISLHGGKPANFLDVGGAATASQVTEAFRIISNDKGVSSILVNIFGGIVKCDIIAEGIIQAVEKLDLNIPIVVRLEGTRAEEAKKLLSQSKLRLRSTSDLDEAAKLVVESCRD